MLVEPACGAVLSALYEYKRLEIEGIYDILSHKIWIQNTNTWISLFFLDALSCGSDGPIVAVVCGGSMASLQMFETWRERLGMSEEDVMWKKRIK